VCIYGGAAGGGKTYGLLLEPLRHRAVRNFAAVIFRRNAVQIDNPGGLWDTSEDLYSAFGGRGSRHRHTWTWDSGFEIRFAHLDREETKFSYQGAQIPFIGFDELTHFSRSQFFYLFSRNRSLTGVPGYIRATTNPGGVDNWVTKLVEWYIGDDGFPIRERSGVIRWFMRDGDALSWGSSKGELLKKHGSDAALTMKSFTFIPARVFDNGILLRRDPSYLANLQALPMVDREALLGGNWHVIPAAGLFFKREWFEVVPVIPIGRTRTIRYWDLAGTQKTDDNDPDWTAGVKMTKVDGGYYVVHATRFRESPAKVEDRIRNIASQDGKQVEVHINQDPGQAGQAQAFHVARMLDGYTIRMHRESGNPLDRVKPFSSQVEHKNVKLIGGSWVDDYLGDLEAFPDGTHDDYTMASAMAYSVLVDDIMPRVLPSALPSTRRLERSDRSAMA
jgi:predicted phage terminase large subunit-like protein